MQTTLESGITAQMISQMTMPLLNEVDEYAIAKKVAQLLGVTNADVLAWHKDSQEKILAIYVEIMLDSLQCPRRLAKKYQIHPNYMQKRLRELYVQMQSDVLLQQRVLKLNRFFLMHK